MTTDKTLKQLENDYSKVLKDLGLMKSKGIAQHVREYVLSHPTVSKSKARPIVVLKYKTLETAKVQAYFDLAKHEDTLATEQVFTKSACLRFRSKSVTERQAQIKPAKKAAKVAKPVAKKAKKPVTAKTRKSNKK